MGSEIDGRTRVVKIPAMYLGKVIVVEGIWRELVFYRGERLVGNIKVVSVVLVRLINAYKRIVGTQLRIEPIWYRSRKLSPCDLPKLCRPESIEPILLYLWEELTERIMSLEDQASTVGGNIHDQLGLSSCFGVFNEDLNGPLKFGWNIRRL